MAEKYTKEQPTPNSQKRRIKIALLSVGLITAISVLLILLYIFIPKLQSKSEKMLYPIDYEDYVDTYCQKYELEKSLVFAIIRTESSFLPNAESGAGAKGLMQITDETFEWMNYIYGHSDNLSSDILFDPETNIMYGCRVLRTLFDYFNTDNMTVILSAYNAGIGYAEIWRNDYPDGFGGISYIPFEETSNYVEKVTSAKIKYKELYGF